MKIHDYALTFKALTIYDIVVNTIIKSRRFYSNAVYIDFPTPKANALQFLANDKRVHSWIPTTYAI